MIKVMITKINDQTNDPITNDQHNDHFTATLGTSHYQIGNILLITINYITSELVRLKKGAKLRE